MPTSDSPDPKTSPEDLSKVGALAIAFFLVQAAGYASVQPSSCIAVSDKAFLVAVAGITHLSHILQPFLGVAWPLGPTVCGLLLLYVPHMPSVLRRAPHSAAAQQLNVRFLAVGLAVVTTSVVGAWLLKGAPELLQVWRSLIAVQYLEPPLYLAVVAVLTMAYVKVLRRTRFCSSDPSVWEYPLPELVASLAAVALLAASYLGARFDGHMDRMQGICAASAA